MCLFQNRAHGTSSRYKLETTNHHGHDFSIGKLATASFPSNISMCVMLEEMLMLEGKIAFVQNRAHGTNSRYNRATTNHHGQTFSIGKLATVSFPSSISMCVYARRKASSH